MLPYVYRKAIFPKSLYAIVCTTWKTNNSEVIELKKKRHFNPSVISLIYKSATHYKLAMLIYMNHL